MSDVDNLLAALSNWMRGPHKGLSDDEVNRLAYISVEDEDHQQTVVYDPIQNEVVLMYPMYCVAVRSNEVQDNQ